MSTAIDVLCGFWLVIPMYLPESIGTNALLFVG